MLAWLVKGPQALSPKVKNYLKILITIIRWSIIFQRGWSLTVGRPYTHAYMSSTNWTQ